MSDFEIEVKVKADNVDSLEKLLASKAEFTGEGYQKDDYFTPANRNFLDKEPVEEWLRLRGTDSGKITYKLWHYDDSGRSNYCDEYETSIGSVVQFRKILDALNFKYLVTVEKHRKTWLLDAYEIAIDTVTDLGDFIEVEYKRHATKEHSAKIVADMIEFLKSAGCTNIRRSYSGYPYAMLHPNEQEFEAV
jgi:adenylate cyclase class 2